MHPFTSQSHLETHTIPNLSKGLAKRSEASQDFVVTVGAIVGIHDGSDAGRLEAETIVRGLLGFTALHRHIGLFLTVMDGGFTT